MIPGPLLLIALGLFTGKAAASTAAKATAVKTTATVGAGAVATVGALGVGIQTFGPGDPSPTTISSPALVERIETGGRIPRDAALVRGTVELPAGTTRYPVITLPCPPGLKVADLAETTGVRLSTEYAAGTVVGVSDKAQVRFVGPALERPDKATVSVLCKVPDEQGSVVAQPPGAARAAGDREIVRVKVPHAYLHVSPDGPVRGSVRLGQPLTLIGEPRDGFQRVLTDQKVRGWVPESALR
jgi:hypothetical protein